MHSYPKILFHSYPWRASNWPYLQISLVSPRLLTSDRILSGQIWARSEMLRATSGLGPEQALGLVIVRSKCLYLGSYGIVWITVSVYIWACAKCTYTVQYSIYCEYFYQGQIFAFPFEKIKRWKKACKVSGFHKCFLSSHLSDNHKARLISQVTAGPCSAAGVTTLWQSPAPGHQLLASYWSPITILSPDWSVRDNTACDWLQWHGHVTAAVSQGWDPMLQIVGQTQTLITRYMWEIRLAACGRYGPGVIC